MITLRRGSERGHANHGWLDTFHTFSFADYYDPQNMGFRTLRVINEDKVDAQTGFGTHGHRDMEIITYIVEGRLDHKDSMGTQQSIRRGEVQRMSAGTGVMHSELNASDAPVHLLQIWILPEQKGLKPSYEQKLFDDEQKKGKLLRIVDNKARDGALEVHQDMSLFASVLEPGTRITHQLEHDHAWLQVIRGEVELNGQSLKAGDGAAVSDEEKLEIEAKAPSELLLFDLA